MEERGAAEALWQSYETELGMALGRSKPEGCVAGEGAGIHRLCAGEAGWAAGGTEVGKPQTCLNWVGE